MHIDVIIYRQAKKLENWALSCQNMTIGTKLAVICLWWKWAEDFIVHIVLLCKSATYLV